MGGRSDLFLPIVHSHFLPPTDAFSDGHPRLHAGARLTCVGHIRLRRDVQISSFKSFILIFSLQLMHSFEWTSYDGFFRSLPCTHVRLFSTSIRVSSTSICSVFECY